MTRKQQLTKRAATAVSAVLILALGAQAAWAAVADGEVRSRHIRDRAIQGIDVATGALNTRTIAKNAINSGRIKNGSIGAVDLAANAVTAGAIADGAVGVSELSAGATTRLYQVNDVNFGVLGLGEDGENDVLSRTIVRPGTDMYLVTGTITLDNDALDTEVFHVRLRQDGTQIATTAVQLASDGSGGDYDVVTLTVAVPGGGGHTLLSFDTFELTASSSSDSWWWNAESLTILRFPTDFASVTTG